MCEKNNFGWGTMVKIAKQNKKIRYNSQSEFVALIVPYHTVPYPTVSEHTISAIWT